MRFVEDRAQRLKVILNIVVLGMALFSLASSDNPIRKISFFEKLMIDSIAPMQRTVTYVKKQITSFVDHYLMNISASKNNVELNREINLLKGRIFEFEELIKENQRLKKLLGFHDETLKKRILAQIVAWDASSDFKVIRINKGLNDGIKLQSTVVTADGLVGYIFRLTENFADVLTILDTNNRIDGILERTRSHGIVEGFSGSRCVMKYVANREPVILNDLIITSGLGNLYPKGIKIGTIAKIERESHGIVQEIELLPSVDFDKIEEVVVLVSETKKERETEWSILDNQTEGGDKR